MNSIDRTPKSTFITDDSNTFANHPKIVSVIFTESIASSLNIKAQHLQDTEENSNKSKICVKVDHSQGNKNVSHEDIILPVSDNLALFRIKQMEESSTSIFEMDDLSINSQENNLKHKNMKQNSSLYLGENLVRTQSFMAVCSNAHDGNLTTDSNKIFVSVQNNNLPLSSSSWVNMCRICHGTDSFEELIGPCRCKGSVALTHLSCLERWLRESANSHCELCLHHYEIHREPKYGILKSIMVWMSSPGEHRAELFDDLVSFSLYTPAAICSTYILMLIGECAAKSSNAVTYNNSHLIMFCAAAGIAAIDFTYSSWLMMRLQHQITSWKSWYRENCCLTLHLPPRKRRRRCAHSEPQQTEQNSEIN